MSDEQAKILKNIPIPTKGVHGYLKKKYPFALMQIGDAMRIDEEEGVFRRTINYAYALPLKRFTSRWLGDHGMVWRVK